MQKTCKNTKKQLMVVGGIGLLVAGLLDIKYKGLVYQAIQKVTCINK